MSEVTGAALALSLLALAAAAIFAGLRQRRNRTALSLEIAALSDAVLRIDANGRLDSIDPGRREARAWTPDGARWQDVIHPDDHGRVEEALGQASRRSVTPVRLRSRDSTWRRGLILWRPAGRGRLDGYFRAYDPQPTGHDLGFTLAPFVTAVTHQLNNRLHLIHGFAEIARQAPRDGGEDPAGRIREVVDESAALLRRLALLTTEPKSAPRDLDVSDQLARIAEFATPILGGKTRIQIHEPDEPLRICTTPQSLLQASTALLIHAAARQGRRGVLELRASRHTEGAVAIDLRSGPSQDLGPDAESAGALALALERLEASGARLEIEGVEGGERLRIVLPSDAPTCAHTAEAGGGRHVLVVDASAHDRAALCEMLEEEGFRSWEAANGAEAAAIAETLSPLTLLIVDLLLDAETGSEVRDRIRARQPDTRVLFTTSFPGVLGVQGAPDDGETPATLAKPYKREELIRRLGEVLDR